MGNHPTVAATTNRHSSHSPRVIVERHTPRSFSATADTLQESIEVLQRQVQKRVAPSPVTLLVAQRVNDTKDFVTIYGTIDCVRDDEEDYHDAHRLWLLGVNKMYFEVYVEKSPASSKYTASVSVKVD